MSDVSLDDFSPHVGDTYQLIVADVQSPAVLVAAEAIPGALRAGGGFRLELLAPLNFVSAQSIMRVEGRDDVHEIFLVPIGRDAEGSRYEAVFY